jgi:hypothetical protein
MGYVICDYFWPNFYFHPVQAGKNVWLAAQGLSIVVYVCYSGDSGSDRPYPSKGR